MFALAIFGVGLVQLLQLAGIPIVLVFVYLEQLFLQVLHPLFFINLLLNSLLGCTLGVQALELLQLVLGGLGLLVLGVHLLLALVFQGVLLLFRP